MAEEKIDESDGWPSGPMSATGDRIRSQAPTDRSAGREASSQTQAATLVDDADIGEQWLQAHVPDGHHSALARQGCVCREQRGRRQVAKLRYRHAGRQYVRYIGADRDLAAAVAAALERRQAARRTELNLKRLEREAAAALRTSWRRIAALLRDAGLRAHGRSIRRPRANRPA